MDAAAPSFVRDQRELREVRATDPGRVRALLAARRRRPLLPPDGRLMVVACDHPARGALAASGRPDAMADRREVVDRLVTALARPGVDGVLGTADVLEDLLLLGALEDKVVLTSMNRGGIAGSAFELDDRMTGYDVRSTLEARFEGAKMLTRIDPDDAGSLATLEACGRAVTELDRAGLVALVEPFMSRRVDGRLENDLSPEAVCRSVAIAQGLGASSAHTWLKLPVVDDMERVLESTNLPTLLLGGDPTAAAEEVFATWAKALAIEPVRGLVVGRTLLFPADGDVGSAVDTAVSLVR